MWADCVFDKSTPTSRVSHMKDEVGELLENPADPWEMADIMLLLLHHADNMGVDLLEATRAKFAVIQQRKWGKADERGVVNHVRE
jgi:hypothetical protein